MYSLGKLNEYSLFDAREVQIKLHDEFRAAILKYDTQQSRKVGYNIYALPHMLNRLHEVEADINNGATIRAALTNGFCGPLLDRLLRVAGLPKSTDEEQRFMGGFTRLTRDEMPADSWDAFEFVKHAKDYLKKQRGTGNLQHAIALNRAIGILADARIAVMRAL